MNIVSKLTALAIVFAGYFFTEILIANDSGGKSSFVNIRDSAFKAASSGNAQLASHIISENSVVSFVNGDKCYPFSPQEKILADFILNDFEQILSDCRSGINEYVGYANKQENASNNNCYLQFGDTLDFAMMSLAFSRQMQIESAIEKSTSLDAEEKEFLAIKFAYTSHYGRFCSFETDELIKRGTAFVVSAEDTLLGKYTYNMLSSPKRSHLNVSSNVFGGISLPNGTIADKIGAGIPAGISMDFGYDRIRILCDFGMLAGISVKDDFKVNGKEWTKESRATGSFINIGAGYNVSPWQTVSIIPFASMHTSSLRNSKNLATGKTDAPANISSGIRPMAGLVLDYNIVIPYCDGEVFGETERRILFLRLKTNYAPNVYGSQSSDFGGDMTYINFGVGLYTDNNR